MKQFKIVIDTKGSDNGAEMMIRGADLALKKYPELSVLLVGDTDVMKRECERLSMPMDRVELLEAPETITNYDSPAEALFVRRVFEDPRNPRPLPFTERFRRDLHARVLYVPTQSAYAEFTRRIADENLFDPSFVKTFSLALACDLAIALTGDSHLAQQLMQKYTASLDEARRSNMTENYCRASAEDSFTEVR